MTKKTIILVLIVLLILNTFFWFHLIVLRVPGKYDTSHELFRKGPVRIVKRTYMERLSIAIGEWKRSKVAITLLVITDTVLIAISFMVILLYKERTIGNKKNES